MLTGFGSDYFIIDDPNNIRIKLSEFNQASIQMPTGFSRLAGLDSPEFKAALDRQEEIAAIFREKDNGRKPNEDEVEFPFFNGIACNVCNHELVDITKPDRVLLLSQPVKWVKCVNKECSEFEIRNLRPVYFLTQN